MPVHPTACAGAGRLRRPLIAEEDAKSGWACCTPTGTSVDSLGFCQAFCQHTQGKSSLKKVSVTSRHKRNVHVHVKMPTRQHGKTLDHRSRGDTTYVEGAVSKAQRPRETDGSAWIYTTEQDP